jgi:hypothetical protein
LLIFLLITIGNGPQCPLKRFLSGFFSLFSSSGYPEKSTGPQLILIVIILLQIEKETKPFNTGCFGDLGLNERNYAAVYFKALLLTLFVMRNF